MTALPMNTIFVPVIGEFSHEALHMTYCSTKLSTFMLYCLFARKWTAPWPLACSSNYKRILNKMKTLQVNILSGASYCVCLSPSWSEYDLTEVQSARYREWTTTTLLEKQSSYKFIPSSRTDGARMNNTMPGYLTPGSLEKIPVEPWFI